MNVRGERILIFGDSLSKHASDSSPEIWDVDQGSNRLSGQPGDLLASLLLEQGADAVRIDARVGRSAHNFWGREQTSALMASDAAFAPTIVFIILGTNDIGLNLAVDQTDMERIRDFYRTLGADVWGIGPFKYVSESLNQQAEPVVKMMEKVFGSRYIDPRPITSVINRARDGVHFGNDSARFTALGLADLITSTKNPLAWQPVAIGAAVVVGIGLIWSYWRSRSYSGSKPLFGLNAWGPRESLSAKQEIVDLLEQRTPEATAAARDLALEHGLVKTGKVQSIKSLEDEDYKGFFEVKINGKRFGTSATLKKGDVIDYVSGRAPWVGDRPQLHPATMVNPASGARWPKSLIKTWVNIWWPDDGSPPVAGLGRITPEQKASSARFIGAAKKSFKALEMKTGVVERELRALKALAKSSSEALNKQRSAIEESEVWDIGPEYDDNDNVIDENEDAQELYDELVDVYIPDPMDLDGAVDIVEEDWKRSLKDNALKLSQMGKTSGLGSSESSSKTRFQELIEDPDPASMEIAEDYVLENELKLSQISSTTDQNQGFFKLSPGKLSDFETQTNVHWKAWPLGDRCRAEFNVTINRRRVGGPAYQHHSDAPSKRYQAFYSENNADRCRQRTVETAWAIAKQVKTLKSKTQDPDKLMKYVDRTIESAITEGYTETPKKPALYGSHDPAKLSHAELLKEIHKAKKQAQKQLKREKLATA